MYPPTQVLRCGFFILSVKVWDWKVDRVIETLLEAEAPLLPSPQRLSHLQLLEAESIQIFREVAAEFHKPVMLYSIGKDSSVMLRLAQKAFYPGPIPFSLCCM